MPRPEEPTQADVLAARFGRVPWRSAIGDAIRGRVGRGSMVLPDRLEGAVYGALVGDMLGSPDGASSPDALAMLRLLDALLDGGGAAPGAPRPSGGAHPDGLSGSSAGALPVALVMRASAAAEVAAAAAATHPADDVDGACASALHALVALRLIDGERDRPGVLAGATRDVRRSLVAAGPPAASPAGPFRRGWDAFAAAADYAGAVSRARATSTDAAAATAIAGGLAGIYWGGSGIPVAWRRGLVHASLARALADRLIETDAPGWDGRPWRTSTSSPLRVDALDLSGLDRCGPGAAGITFLPGRRYVGYHTGANWRDLETDAARLHEIGVDALVLLVEDAELVRCRVTGIGEALAAHGIEVVRFPIRDPLLPRDGDAFRRTIAAVLARVRRGESVAIACRGGLDRAGLTAGCLLREAGLGPEEAIERVQRARRGALTLPDQQAYVRAWGHPAAAQNPRRR